MRLLPVGWRRITVLLFIIVLFTATSVYSEEFSDHESEYPRIALSDEEEQWPVRADTYIEHPRPDYTDDELNYFKEIALKAEYGPEQQGIHKWMKELKIRVNGWPTHEDLNTLTGLISRLNRLSENLHIRYADTEEEANAEEEANVEVYFIPHAKFPTVGSLERKVYEENWGLGIVTWSELGEINKAIVLIATDKPNQEERDHLIQEELTQSLGLLNDSWTDPESIFYQGWGTQRLTLRDQKMVRILYDARVKPNMQEAELDKVLRNK